MHLVSYIVLGIIIVILLLIYMLFVLAYLGASKGYRAAKKVNAIILGATS